MTTFLPPAAAALPTVLIVDDDRLIRTTLAELLQEDHRILLARDGEGALAQVSAAPVDLILLDVTMPGMDGFEVLARLQGDESSAHIPVIFLTGKTEAAEEERGFLLGASDYVNKPIRGAVVRARVRAHLALARQRRELQAHARQDALTGLANRRAMDEAVEEAIAQARHNTDILGFAIFDVDCFKQYNDHYGHAAGDDVLARVARCIGSVPRRRGDLAARYGGEEFALLMPGCTDFSEQIERVRRLVLNEAIPHERSVVAPQLTLSGGAILCHIRRNPTPRDIFELADRMLYEAKSDGRNRTRIRLMDL